MIWCIFNWISYVFTCIAWMTGCRFSFEKLLCIHIINSFFSSLSSLFFFFPRDIWLFYLNYNYIFVIKISWIVHCFLFHVVSNFKTTKLQFKSSECLSFSVLVLILLCLIINFDTNKKINKSKVHFEMQIISSFRIKNKMR